MSERKIYLGYEPREHEGFAVCRQSILRRLKQPAFVHSVMLRAMMELGLYTRPTERRDGLLYDTISATDTYDGQMATEFAITRFLVPTLARRGWALFLDASDMLVRCDLSEVFDIAEADPSKAVFCVQHDYKPSQATKMDGVTQSFYARKNWSSFMLFNCDHPDVQRLTATEVNAWPGRMLHSLTWTRDEFIGALPATYNHLVGEVPHDPDAKVVHWTLGGPWFPEHADAPFADEWRAERQVSAAA